MSDKTTRPATGAEHWVAIKFLARHIFRCWPRRWRYEWASDKRDRRTCLRCGLIHEYDA